jgi:hypothetical protein
MEKYVTLVFKTETQDQIKAAREMAEKNQCIAWSLDHEILRGDLMRKAIDDGDLKKAEEYGYTADASQYLDDLDDLDDLKEIKIKASMKA